MSEVKEVSMKEIFKMSNSLKQKIVRRNRIEWIAALVVIIAFAYRAWRAETVWSVLMNMEVAIAAVYVGIQLWRRGRYETAAGRELPSVDFIRHERNQIERQIKLLSTIKYWYVLPLLFGVVGLISEQIFLKWNPNHLPWVDIVQLIATISVGVGISYANEVYGVRKLKASLAAFS